MRISKERAKQVRTRPNWLTNDDHWSIFVDYRDSIQSADDLALLRTMSRAQVQNVVRNIIDRCSRPSEISAKAVKVLRSEGLTLAPAKLRQELEELNARANNPPYAGKTERQGLEDYLSRCVENCGPKTTQEILRLYEDYFDVPARNPAAA